MYKPNRILAVLLVVMIGFALILAGCGSDEVSLDPADISGTITFGGWPAGDDAVNSIIAGFNELYPNVTVELEMTSPADHHDRLLASLAARAGAPDVVMIEAEYIGAFRDRPGFVNLLDEPFNAGRFADDFVDFKWEHGVSIDGSQMVGLTWDIGPLTMFYNRRMFEAAGLPSDPDSVFELMNSPEGFLEAARAMHIPDERWLIGNAIDLISARWSNRDFYNEDLSLRIDEPESVELIELAGQIRSEGLDANVEMWGGEWTSLLGDNRLAIVSAGSWFGGFLKSWIAPDSEGDWGVARQPLFDSVNWGGSFLAIPAMSNNQAAAWAFIEYMLTTVEAQNAMFAAVDYFPSLIPAWDDPFYDEPDPYFGGQRTRRLWADIAERIEPSLVTPMDIETQGIFASRVNVGIDAGESAEIILADTISEILRATAPEREALSARLGLD